MVLHLNLKIVYLYHLFLKQHSIQGKNRLSKFFISHDIDTIYGSFLQDGLWAVKNKKVGVVLKLILNDNHLNQNCQSYLKYVCFYFYYTMHPIRLNE